MDTQSDILTVEYVIEVADPIIQSEILENFYCIVDYVTPNIVLDSCKFANAINVLYYYKKYTEDPIPFPIISNHAAIISNDFILMEMIDEVSIKEDIVYKEIKKNNMIYKSKIGSKNSLSFSQTLDVDEECDFVKYKEDRFIILREYENGEIQHLYGCSINSYKISEENNNKYNIEINIDKITKKYPAKVQIDIYLEKIIVTNPETNYIEGELFKKGSMIVTAIMSDGTTKIVQNYSTSIIIPLATKGIKPVLITYIENNIVKTNNYNIIVT